MGAALAGGALRLVVAVGGVSDRTDALGTNSWGPTVNGFGTFLVEVLLTFLLVLVVLMVTRTDAAPVSRDVDPTTAAPETARDVP